MESGGGQTGALPVHDAALDGLRAVAAGLVVLTHAAFLSGAVNSAGLVGHLMGRGDFGVAIFFALSGYLLHRGFLRAPASRATLPRYYLRRAARVLPAYWLVLLVVALTAHPSTRDLVLHALGMQIYARGSHLPSFSQAWSIATELSFYAVLPLIAAALARLRTRRPDAPLGMLTLTLPLAVLVTGLVPATDVDTGIPAERWLPARAASFLVGMILAEAVARPDHPVSTRLRSWTRPAGPILVVGAAAYLFATTPVAGLLTLGVVDGWRLAAKMALSCVVAGALLLPLVLGGANGYARALAHPAMAWLGRVSYGTFLWHVPVFTGMYAVSGVQYFSGGLLPLLALGVPITLALATLSYHLVELPLMRWAARRRGRARPAPAAHTAAPRG
ncbi:acyltransferase [Nostocoides veronense]|uniref:acyltransferase family protein n=1 Tax=Nostocoides veronense TaxID=330836 RepID=UPI0031D7BA66